VDQAVHDACQALAVVGREAVQSGRDSGTRQPDEGLEDLVTGPGELEPPDPTILEVADALQVALGLEAVAQGDHRAGWNTKLSRERTAADPVAPPDDAEPRELRPRQA